MKIFKTCYAGAALCLTVLAHSAAADPADDFGWVLIAKVNEGAESAAVDALVAEIMDAARGNTGTITFNFARVGNTIYGYELFDNQAAFFEHFSRVEPLVPRLMQLWTPTEIIPTHDMPEQVSEIMRKLGAVHPDMTATLVH